MKIRFDSSLAHHFAGAGKMIARGKGAVPIMEPDEKDAGGLLGEAKPGSETEENNPCR